MGIQQYIIYAVPIKYRDAGKSIISFMICYASITCDAEITQLRIMQAIKSNFQTCVLYPVGS